MDTCTHDTLMRGVSISLCNFLCCASKQDAHYNTNEGFRLSTLTLLAGPTLGGTNAVARAARHMLYHLIMITGFNRLW